MSDLAAIEVEFNVNPTSLFLHIDQSEWAEAADRARCVPIEAKTWLVSKVGTRVEWRYLPLHLCLQFNPPYDVIEALLSVYPDAVHQRDHEERLPLHVYCRANSMTSIEERDVEGIVNLLLHAYPDSLHVPDESGMTPLQIVEGISRSRYSSRTDSIRKALSHAVNAAQSAVQHNDAYEEAPADSVTGTDSIGSNFDSSLQVGKNKKNPLVHELESALALSQKGGNEANEEVARLRQEHKLCLKLIEKLKGKLSDVAMLGDDGLARQYEDRVDKANQDLEECRNKLKAQVDTFEKELIHFSSANDDAVWNLKQEFVKKEQSMDRKTKGLIAVNQKLADRIDRLEAQEDDHQSRIEMVQKAMAKERTAMKEEAVRMDRDRNAWEEEKEGLVKSVKFLKQSMTEQATITKTAFGRRVKEMETKIADKDRAIEQLTSQLQTKAATTVQLAAQLKEKTGVEEGAKAMRADNEEKSREISRLRENAQKALKMTSNDFQSKKRELEDQVVRQQRLLDERSKEVDNLNEQRKTLLVRCESQKSVLTEMKDKGASMARSKAGFEEEIRQTKDELHKVKSELQKEREDKETEGKGNGSKIQILERRNEELRRKVKDLDSKRGHLKDAIAKNNETVRTKVKAMQKEKSTLSTENERLERTVRELKARSETFQLELGEYKKRYYSESRSSRSRQSSGVVSENLRKRELDDSNKKIILLTAENKKLKEILRSGGKATALNSSGWEQEIAVENLKLQLINLEGENDLLKERAALNDKHQRSTSFESESASKDRQLQMLEQENVALKLTIGHLEAALTVPCVQSSDDSLLFVGGAKLSKLSMGSTIDPRTEEALHKQLDEIKSENETLSKKLQDLTNQKTVIESKHISCDDQIQSLKKRNGDLELKKDELKDNMEANNMLHYERVRELSEKKQELERELFACQMKLEQTRKVLDSTIKLQQEMEGVSVRSSPKAHQAPTTRNTHMHWMERDSSQQNEDSYNYDSTRKVLDSTIKLQQEMEGVGMRSSPKAHQAPTTRNTHMHWMERDSSQQNEDSYNYDSTRKVLDSTIKLQQEMKGVGVRSSPKAHQAPTTRNTHMDWMESDSSQQNEDSYSNIPSTDSTRKVLDSTIKLQQEMEGVGVRSSPKAHQAPTTKNTHMDWMERDSSQQNEDSYNYDSVNDVSYQMTGDSNLNEPARYENSERYNQFTHQESRDDYDATYNRPQQQRSGSRQPKVNISTSPINDFGQSLGELYNKAKLSTKVDRKDKSLLSMTMNSPRNGDNDRHDSSGQRLDGLYNKATFSTKVDRKDKSLLSMTTSSPRNSPRNVDNDRHNSRKTNSQRNADNYGRQVTLQESDDEQNTGMEGIFGNLNLEAAKNRCLINFP
jgi:chromosome segregation ATPase